MNKELLYSAGVAALVASLVFIVGFWLVGSQSADLLGGFGQNRYPNSGFAMRYLQITDSPATSTAIQDSSLYVKGTSTQVGAVSLSTSLTVGSSGTAINKYLCGTATFRPGTLNGATAASTTVSVLGATLGDIVFASFNSASSTGLWQDRKSTRL